MKTTLIVLLTALLISAGVYALEPFTIGNVSKLGTSTTVGLPACTATIRGGLIYDTDTDQVKVCTGSVWKIVP